MKTVLIISIVLSAIFTSCKKDAVISPVNNPTSQLNNFPKEPLSADEISSLQWMREEEKLAHDVYTTLYAKWNIKLFTNIAASEQTHTESVLTLINKYGLADPVKTNEVGVFSNATLRNLYEQLVNKGSASILDALTVGATIEDLDIYDLNNWSTKVDNQDINFVYQSLAKGSRNHMRSFYSQIISSGGAYTAQFISMAAFEAIINSPIETGP